MQTPAGPFVGTLTMTGKGLSGTVRLSAAGRYQRADVDARAAGAEIPGERPILIQRGLIAATIILYPDAPHIVGDAQLAGVRSDNFALSRARAKIDYRGGRGTAQLFAEGTSGVSFRVAANAELSPERIRAAAQGQVNRIPFRFARPAEISKRGNAWQLATQIAHARQRPASGSYGKDWPSVAVPRLRLSMLNDSRRLAAAAGDRHLDFAQAIRASRARRAAPIEGFTHRHRLAPAGRHGLLGTLRRRRVLNAVIRRGGAGTARASGLQRSAGRGW